jgi:hypothetical protein
MKTKQIWTAAMLLTLISCGGDGIRDKIDLIPIRRDGDTYVYRADIVVQPEMKITQSSVFRGKYAVVRVRENGKFGFLNRKGQLSPK